MSNDDEIGIEEDYSAPDWLRKLLSGMNVSPGFRERCEEAGSLAYGLVKMREVKQHNQFVALPFGDLVRVMADSAGIDSAPILQWFGVADLERPEAPSAEAPARLAVEIGFEEAETEAALQYSLAKAYGFATVPLLVAGRREQSSDVDELSACQAALKEIQALFPPDLQQKARRLSETVRRVYAQQRP
jgi:hypothetical protein